MKIRTASFALLLLSFAFSPAKAFELPSTRRARLAGEEKAREVAQALMGDRERQKVQECIRKNPDSNPRPAAAVHSKSTHFGAYISSLEVFCGSGANQVSVIFQTTDGMHSLGYPIVGEARVWTLDQLNAALQPAFDIERNRAKAAKLGGFPD